MPGGRSGSGGREGPGAAERGELVAGRYELAAFLGRGGLGEVWAARDRRLHRDVAVKIFGRAGFSSGGLPDWLRREGITAAQITHPNVAVVHDQGTDELGRLYLVMELVTGASLREVLAAGRLPVPDVLAVGVQICEALAAAHAAGVVHRDVKPHNILITADSTVKMVDFGIAGFLNDTRSWSAGRSADAVKGSGTPDYAAPEQILGKRADARSDLYAVGTLLFAMLAGQTPFPAENFLAVMHRKVTEHPPDVREQRPGLPTGLAEVVRELMARDPAERPGSAAEVARRLRNILIGLNLGEMSQPEVEVEMGIGASIADQPAAAAEIPAQVVAGGEGEPQLEPEPGPEEEAEGDGAADADVLAASPGECGVEDGEAGEVYEAVEAVESVEAADEAVEIVEVVEAADEAEKGAVPVEAVRAAPIISDAAPGAEPWRPPEPEASGTAPPAEPAAAPEADLVPQQAATSTPPPEPAAPPVWGAAEARDPDRSATSATRLSPLAPPAIHGRSLLPPPPRSLLQEPPAQRFAPVTPQPSPPAFVPGPPLLKTHETARRILVWVTLTVLVAAAIGTVFVAVTRH